MAIKIRQTPYENPGSPHPGPFTVHPDVVRAHLIEIAMAGAEALPDTFGEDPDPVDADYTVVSFDPGPQDLTTPAGRVRQKLKELIDQAGDVVLFGFDSTYVSGDGTTFEDSAGSAIGNWIFYDTENCQGNGRWVRGTDGNQVCTTSTGILWHELGHQWRGDGPTVDPDTAERGAVEIENDLRLAQGLVPRDPDHWPESDCGCPNGCCIVASVATGSPFSDEVHALRRVRDGMLRGTGLGARFFNRLLADYYALSVPLCRAMLSDSGIRSAVETVLVQPLVRAYGLAIELATDAAPEARAAAALRSDTARALFDAPISAVAGSLSWDAAAAALKQIGAGEVPVVPATFDPALASILEQLAERLGRFPLLRWAMVEPAAIYASARALAFRDNASAGRCLVDDFDDWLARAPFDDELLATHPVELLRDLEGLAAAPFARPAVRLRIGERLLHLGIVVPRSRLAARLVRLGYLR